MKGWKHSFWIEAASFVCAITVSANGNAYMVQGVAFLIGISSGKSGRGVPLNLFLWSAKWVAINILEDCVRVALYLFEMKILIKI